MLSRRKARTAVSWSPSCRTPLPTCSDPEHGNVGGLCKGKENESANKQARCFTKHKSACLF